MKNILITCFVIFSFGVSPLMSQDLSSEANIKKSKFVPGYGFKKLSNPVVFQGNRKRKKYFEGWYFKMVSSDGSSILSVIPGISISEDGKDQHAFIQVIDGKTANTFYYNYPIDSFWFSKEQFAIRIGSNYFSEERVILDIETDSTSFKGEITMTDQVYLTNRKKKNKGIMGWYRYVPFMQCYHGVVSLNHNLSGSINSSNRLYNFDNGLGYIEKDWGKSMPSAWIWMQSNNFNTENTSFMLSVANVPWLGSSFTGFLGFFHNDEITERFGTYTKADLQLEIIDPNNVKITITNNGYHYIIETYRNNSGELKAPVKGSMERRISESIDATIHLVIKDLNSNIVFQDSASISGLEMVGDLETLKSN